MKLWAGLINPQATKGKDLVVQQKSPSDGPMVLPRAFDLLDALADGRTRLTLSEVALRLDVPRSSLSTLLKAMTDLELLNRSGNAYSIGPRAYEMASKILTGRSLRRVSRPSMEKAQAMTGETIILAELDQDRKNVYYTDTITSEKSVRFYVPIASRRPLYASATGRVFLAHFSQEVRAQYFDSITMEPLSELTVTDRGEMETLLEAVKVSGVAVTLGQLSEDASGFAAPIFDETGTVRAAIAVGVPTTRAQKNADIYRSAAKEAGQAVSRILGYDNK